jgi:hypothetical protein
MSKKSTWGFLTTGFAGLTAYIVWSPNLRQAMRTLGECIRPTTVEMMPLPKGCVPTTEAPPANLMRIVDRQEGFYRLTRQKLVVCTTASRLPSGEPDFSEAAFAEDVRRRWLPLYVGCCSYQFRRHVTAVAADPKEAGSVVVEAALVVGRWDFFRLNWSNEHSGWF